MSNLLNEKIFNDEYFMKEAVNEAKKALKKDEVPIGAVIVSNNKIIARGHNMVETLKDSTAHAEILAFTSASEYMGGKFLEDCTLYVTLEPCVMCAGASYWNRITNIVYGCKDEKRGYSTFAKNILHPKTTIKGGVLKDECSELLKDFFKKKREK